MKLPIFKSPSKPLYRAGGFGGISEESLLDAVNLICSENCHTRKARKAVMLHSQAPDQIIPCENRLFFRFGNTIKEITRLADGSLCESGTEYALKALNPAPDRKIIIWGEELYILPDNIQVGVDTWLPFGEGYSASVAFPFINPRTFYYPSGYSGDDYCDDAFFLQVGMKLRFSWAPLKEFTIKTIDSKKYYYDESVIEEGIRITLDADVPNYNALPQNAKAEYTNPKNRPILNDLTIGYNHKITFGGQTIAIYTYGESYSFSFKDYFKKGQTVKISGSSIESNNLTAKILHITDTTMSFDKELTSIIEEDKTIINISPVIPDFTHFLITEDRLFGIENQSGIFYISALGNPFLFYDSPALPEDSWSVKIGKEGTGITLWKDSIICFTEDSGFRILGYHALNFGIRQLSLNGIKKDSAHSLIRVGDTLYYSSEKGIMKYSGGSDKRISNSVLQISNIKAAITDGTFVYMLSNNRIWVYDTEMERWWSENAENISGLFKFGGQIYLNSPEAVYITESDLSSSLTWSFELPLIKDKNQKKLIPICFMLDYLKSTNCDFTLYFKAFGADEPKNCGTYKINEEGSIKIPLPKNHCGGFKIEVVGKGAFHPDSWNLCYKNL